MQRFNNIWITLGIDSTSDRKEVRRAYARRLKDIDQATQLAEFEALREAYEQALFHCDMAEEEREQPPQIFPDVTSRPEPENITKPMPPQAPAYRNWRERRSEEIITKRLQYIFSILAEKGSGTAELYLNKTLNRPFFINLENRQKFEYGLIEIFLEKDPLPLAFAKIAVVVFNWNQQAYDRMGLHSGLSYLLNEIALKNREPRRNDSRPPRKKPQPPPRKTKTGSGGSSGGWMVLWALVSLGTLGRVLAGGCDGKSSSDRIREELAYNKSLTESKTTNQKVNKRKTPEVKKKALLPKKQVMVMTIRQTVACSSSRKTSKNLSKTSLFLEEGCLTLPRSTMGSAKIRGPNFKRKFVRVSISTPGYATVRKYVSTSALKILSAE